MTTKPRIGIILGTTRPARFADKPANWLLELAGRREDANFEIVDLRDYPMPFFEEDRSPAFATPTHPDVVRWAHKMAELDGYIFVTAEYNHSISGVLKNAMDFLQPEVWRKPASFLGYGGTGAARAVEHLRGILAEMQVATLKFTVHVGMVEFLGVARDGKSIGDFPYLVDSANKMLDDIVWWSRTLAAGRQETERETEAA